MSLHTEQVKKINPVIIPSAEHPIAPSRISDNAGKVLTRLREAGYAGYMVGGCVRDLMLGHEPKDFDVVTDARPEQIKTLFRNALLIGRRFRLAHVRFGREIIEVATFRAAPGASTEDEDEAERRARENVFGSREEDALRRDFTVNALYYDPADSSIIDYVGGVADLKQGILRMIGDPETRYREDPVRMLRAVRFAARLGFSIEPHTAAPLPALASLLRDVSPARLFEEALKLFQGGYALQTFELLRRHGLFQFLFPLTEKSLEKEQQGFPLMLLPRALANTDKRVNEDKPVTPAFLFAALLWEPVRLEAQARAARGIPPHEALQGAAEQVLREQLRSIALPKRFSFPMREIWAMQAKFSRRSGKQALRLLAHKRFRAAYDFLLLRAEAGEESPELAEWWTRFQAVNEAQRLEMVQTAPTTGTKRKRPPRRRNRAQNRVH